MGPASALQAARDRSPAIDEFGVPIGRASELGNRKRTDAHRTCLALPILSPSSPHKRVRGRHQTRGTRADHDERFWMATSLVELY